MAKPDTRVRGTALRWIGVASSERSLFTWGALSLLLTGAAAFALVNAAETLFLKRVGVEFLPLALLANAVLLVLTTAVLERRIEDSDRVRWFTRVLVILSVLLLPFWLLAESRAAAVSVGIFLLARQVLPLSLFIFWVALGDLLTARRAKRLFAPLAAGVTLGGIIGSFASDPVARALGMRGLVLCCAVALVGAAAAGRRMRLAHPRQHEPRAASLPRSSRIRTPWIRRAGDDVSVVRLWRESRLFRLLAVALICGGTLSPVLYYQFSFLADAATTGANGEQELLALYAQFRGWVSVAILIFQLWLSDRLYRRFGLPLSIALWPAVYLLGFVWLGVDFGLVVVVASLGAARNAEEGVAAPALRVLFNLFPERLRSRASGLLAGPINRLGGILGNLLVLTGVWVVGATWLGYAAIPVAMLWLGAALALWRAYPTLLLQASSERSLAAVGADTAKLLDRRTALALAPSLANPAPPVCQAAIDLVMNAETSLAVGLLAEAIERAPEITRPLLVDALHRLVEPLPPGRVRNAGASTVLGRLLFDGGQLPPDHRADLLQVLARLTGGEGAPEAMARESTAWFERALGDREAAVRLAAIVELHRRGRPPPGASDLDAILEEALASRDVLMRRSARKELRAVLLSTEPGAVWKRRLALLAARIDRRADRAETAEALAEVARQHDGAAVATADSMLRRVGDHDPRVRAAILSFAGYAGLVDQAPRLLMGLRSRHSEEAIAAREGLVALGPEVAQPLLIEYGQASTERRVAAMSVLSELDGDAAALHDFYRRELDEVRGLLILRAALGSDHPAKLVLRQLEERVVESLAALLSHLAVLHEDDRFRRLETYLRRPPDRRRRDFLLEALEALLSPSERADLLPLVETGLWDDRGRRIAEQLGRRLPSSADAWSALGRDRDPLTRRLVRAFTQRPLEGSAAMRDARGVRDPVDLAVRLQEAAAFDRLSTQQLVNLAEVLKEERYRPGAVVYAEGDEGTSLYFVLEGEVELRIGTLTPVRHGPGSFFGELSALDGMPPPSSVTARKETRLLRLERGELLLLMEEAPVLGIGLSQFLALQVRSLQDQLRSSR